MDAFEAMMRIRADASDVTKGVSLTKDQISQLVSAAGRANESIVQSSKKSIKDIEADLNSSLNTLEKLQAIQKVGPQAINELQGGKQYYSQQVDAGVRQLKESTKQLTDAQKQLAITSTQAATAQGHLSSIQQNLDRVQRELAQAGHEEVAANGNLIRLTQELSQAQSSQARSGDAVIRAQDMLARRYESLNRLYSSGLISQAEFQRRLQGVASAYGLVTRAQQINEQRLGEVNRLQQEVSLASQTYAEKQQLVVRLSQEQAQVNNTLAEAERNLVNIQKELTVQDAGVKAQEEGIRTLTQQVVEARANLVRVTDNLKLAEKTLSEAKRQEGAVTRQIALDEKELGLAAENTGKKVVAAAKEGGAAYAGFGATVGTHVAGLAVRLQGAQIGLAGLGTGLEMAATRGKDFLGGAIQSTADFEKQLLTIQAVMGSQFKGNLDEIRQLALNLGRDTVFTATEAAGSIEMLVKAGMSWENISGGAARAVLDLAAATGETLPSSVQVATTAMNIFGYKGEEMGKVADIITKAVNASKISAQDFSQALVNMGPIAALFKMKFEDVAKIIAALGNLGVQGGTAGTALRNFFENMIPRTGSSFNAMEQMGLITVRNTQALKMLQKEGLGTQISLSNLFAAYQKATGGSLTLEKATDGQIASFEKWAVSQGILQSKLVDTNGDIKDLGGSLKILYDTVKDLPDDARIEALANIFKERGGTKAAAPIVQMFDQIEQHAQEMGVSVDDAFAQITSDMNRAGGAADIQSQIMAGLSGRIEYLRGSWDALVKTMGAPFQVPLAKAVDKVAQLVNNVTALTAKNPQLATALGYIVAAATAIASVAGPVTLFMAAAPYLMSAISGIGLAILPVLALLAALTIAGQGFFELVSQYSSSFKLTISAYSKEIQDVMHAVQMFGYTLYDGIIKPLGDQFARFIMNQLIPGLVKLAQWFTNQLPQVEVVVDHAFNGLLLPVLRDVWNLLKTYVVPILGKFAEAVLAVAPSYIDGLREAWDTLSPVLKAIGDGLSITLIPALTWIKEHGGDVGTALAGLTAAWVALDVAMDANPAGAIIILFLTLMAVIGLLKTAWDNDFLGIRTALTATWQAVSNFVMGTLQFFKSLSDGITEFVNGASNTLTQFVNDMSDALAFMANNWAEFAQAMFDIVSGRYQQGADRLIAIAQQTALHLQEIHREAARKVDQAYGDALIANVSYVGNAVHYVVDTVKNILDTGSNGGFSAGWNLISGWGNGIIGAGNKVLTQATTIFNQVAGLFGISKTLSHSAGSAPIGGYFGHGGMQGVDSQTGRPMGTEQEEYYSNYLKNKGLQASPVASIPGLPLGGGTTPYSTPAGASSGGSGGSSAGATKSAAQSAADAVRTVADAIKAGIQAFKDISSLTIPGDLQDKSNQFAQAASVLIMAVQKVALQFTDKNLATIGAFGDSAGKVTDFLSKFVDFSAKINDPKFTLGPVVDKVTVLIKQAHVMMNLLGSAIAATSDGPGWTEENIQTVGDFADAGGKVTDFLSKFVDFMQKINAPGFTLGPMVEKVTHLVKQAHIMMNLLGDALKGEDGWTPENITKVGAFADAGGKVVDLLSKFATFMQQITAKNFNLADVIPVVRELVRQSHVMVNLLGQAITGEYGWTPENITKVGSIADAGGKVADMLGKYVTLMQTILSPSFKLADVKDAVENIVNQSALMMDLLGGAIAGKDGWTPDNLTRVGTFSDNGGKVADFLGKFVTLMETVLSPSFKIGDIKEAVQNLATQATQMMDALMTAVSGKSGWTDENVAHVGVIADNAGKVVDLLSKTVTLLQTLGQKLKLGTASSATAIIAAVVQMVDDFTKALQDAGVKLDKDSLDVQGSVATLADDWGKVVAVVSSTFDAMQKLSTGASVFKANPGQFIGQVVSGLVQIVRALKDALSSGGLGAIIDSLDMEQVNKIGPAVSALSGVFDIFTKLASFAPMSQLKLDLFRDSFVRLLKEIPAIATALSSDALDAANEFGQKMGPALDVLSKALDLFTGITGTRDKDGKITGGLMAVDPAAIGELTGKLHLLIQKLKTDLLDKIAPEMMDLANQFGQKMGPALDILSKALEIFKGITGDENGKGKLLQVDPNAIGALVGNLYLLLHHWHNLIIGGEFQGDFAQRSADFASIVSLVIGTIQQVVDMVRSIQDAGGMGKLLDVMNKLSAAMSMAATTQLPAVSGSFVSFFQGLLDLFTQMTHVDDTQSPLFMWGGKDANKSFLGRLLFQVEGKSVGIRWWIFEAFKGMFVSLLGLFQDWGNQLVKFWEQNVLGTMKTDTASFISDMQNLFKNTSLGVPGLPGSGNGSGNGNGNGDGNGKSPHLPGGGSMKTQGISTTHNHYSIRHATFVTDKKTAKDADRRALQRAANPA